LALAIRLIKSKTLAHWEAAQARESHKVAIGAGFHAIQGKNVRIAWTVDEEERGKY
jgi:hypothetical protein